MAYKYGPGPYGAGSYGGSVEDDAELVMSSSVTAVFNGNLSGINNQPDELVMSASLELTLIGQAGPIWSDVSCPIVPVWVPAPCLGA